MDWDLCHHLHGVCVVVCLLVFACLCFCLLLFACVYLVFVCVCLVFASACGFEGYPCRERLLFPAAKVYPKKNVFRNITWFSEEKPSFKAIRKYALISFVCTGFRKQTRFFNRKPGFRRVAGAKPVFLPTRCFCRFFEYEVGHIQERHVTVRGHASLPLLCLQRYSSFLLKPTQKIVGAVAPGSNGHLSGRPN